MSEGFGRFDVYCDESGHSGANLNDKSQPVYILAGWTVHDDMSGAEECIRRCRAQAGTQSTELKASLLLRRPKGQQAIADLFRCLGKNGCMPMFTIAEKRYVVAGKVVDILLDPVDNPLADNRIRQDAGFTQEVADRIYELPDKVLDRFAESYRAPSEIGLQRTVDEIGRVLGILGRVETKLSDFGHQTGNPRSCSRAYRSI